MTTQEFIFDTPLYQKVEGEDALRIVEELSVSYNPYSSPIGFDGFNPNQSKESTYIIESSLQCRANTGLLSRSGGHSKFEYTEPWYVTLKCCRYGDAIDIVLLLSEDRSIMKIGQYPTIAHVHIGQIQDYKGVLSKEELKEFTRAIGLAANGGGIGSFVYLRRIFENLIQSAYEQALKEYAIDREQYARGRMNDKIALLHDFLPETLVEIKEVYGILSKGIHELSEEECLLYFNTMRNGIEIILDDKLEQKKKELKRKETLENISKIKAKVK
jgi:hypothetical protein